MNRILLSLFLLAVIGNHAFAQSADEQTIRQIYDKALAEGKSYQMLDYLSNTIGHRLSGSPGAATAVNWTRDQMLSFGFDSVWLQPVMVPHWVRGKAEIGKIISTKSSNNTTINVCALGGSDGTGPKGITAVVIEVKSLAELKDLGTQNIQGKIVFFNRPMDPKLLSTFAAYGGAVDQRALGASEAAKYGAVASLTRSMSPDIEDYPHTGMMIYTAGVTRIPSLAVSTKHADLISKLLREDKGLKLYLESHSETLADVPSFNVVGEIKGSEHKGEIIVVGGHLDSWDLGTGAHDDGAGCVQSIEVLRIFKTMGYKPKRTIRAVMFMNEENGLRGGTKYAELSLTNKEHHIAAIESDRGGFTPRGFTILAKDEERKKIQSWKPLLEPYGLTDFDEVGAGADIGPLEPQGPVLMEFLPDSQRYFGVHHTREDVFRNVNRRELELGAASMAAMVYLLDKYGVK